MKRILTGTESFEKLIEGDYFYVDKTMFIKELLENKGEVTLITRPRRFGKTLNMSMLKSFFDVRSDNKTMFGSLNIMRHKDIVEKRMNKYPVVSFTMKNVELLTYKESIETIRILVSELYQQNLYVYESDRLNAQQKKRFHKYFSEEATDAEMRLSLSFLTQCLYAYHQKRAIILMDEYDAPIANALQEGYYQDMIKFMRSFMGSAFKSNDYLEFGVLTGVQRVSKEGMVSSFNNPNGLICQV